MERNRAAATRLTTSIILEIKTTPQILKQVMSLNNDLAGLKIDSGVTKSPFPAVTKNAVGNVGRTPTAVFSISFADKIMVTISQAGRLSQWIQVPLSSPSPASMDSALPTGEDDLLPITHLTPKTLMGGGGEQREAIGHLYATQIATLISTRNPEETRTLVVGIGLQKIDMAREAWFDILELIQHVV